MTCGLSPYRYSNHSRFKYDVAMWHLLQFRRALDIVPSSAMFFRFDGEHALSPVWGHADGVVLQLHAAFDAWACALAHRHAWPSSDRASFRMLGGKALHQTAEMKAARRILEPILTAAEWGRLVELRDRAAHRTIIGGSLRLHDEGASGAFFEHHGASRGEGTEVLPELERLAQWADGPLAWLWEVAEGWRHQCSERCPIVMLSGRVPQNGCGARSANGRETPSPARASSQSRSDSVGAPTGRRCLHR